MICFATRGKYRKAYLYLDASITAFSEGHG